MPNILTSDQFVAGVVSVLALQNRKSFVLTDTDLDDRFARAYADLVDHVEEFDVVPNFSFLVDDMHGDSISLRETLLAAKEKELIALNNPTFRTFEIKLDDRRAKRYLARSPVPEKFFEDIVMRHFRGL
jgi:hypothetical protein